MIQEQWQSQPLLPGLGMQIQAWQSYDKAILGNSICHMRGQFILVNVAQILPYETYKSCIFLQALKSLPSDKFILSKYSGQISALQNLNEKCKVVRINHVCFGKKWARWCTISTSAIPETQTSPCGIFQLWPTKRWRLKVAMEYFLIIPRFYKHLFASNTIPCIESLKQTNDQGYKMRESSKNHMWQ